MRRGFVFNLDAEHELEAGPRWTPPRSLSQRLDAIAEQVKLPEGGVLVVPGRPVPEAQQAILWCPTPRSVALAREAGLEVPAHPPFEVIRRVNDRAFAFQLAGHELLPSALVGTVEAAVEALARPSPTGRWRLKKGLGASGRGQRTELSGHVHTETRAWLRRAVQFTTLVIEPEVAIEREFTVYGWVRAGGSVRLSGLRGQAALPNGTFLRCARIDTSDAFPWGHLMMEAAEHVGVELGRAGYFGPFGIDGYVFRDGRGAPRLRAVSEINARYSMGWDTQDGYLAPP